MSTEYYLKQGYTPLAKTTRISALGTASVWTPTSGKRIAITGISFASNSLGTIAFYFEGESKFAEFILQESATISPIISAIESTMVGGKIFATLGGAATTKGCVINLQGFELL